MRKPDSADADFSREGLPPALELSGVVDGGLAELGVVGGGPEAGFGVLVAGGIPLPDTAKELDAPLPDDEIFAGWGGCALSLVSDPVADAFFSSLTSFSENF